MPSSAWKSLSLLLEAPGPPARKKGPVEKPAKAAADAMTGNDDARRMVWLVLSDEAGREFFSNLSQRGWKRGKVGVYDLLWHGEEWRLVSSPQGSGLGRSIEAIFSLFEPVSKEAQRLYGWRTKDDSDKPSQEFIDWASGALRNLQRFSNALPKYVDARIEPVSAMGSNPSSVKRPKPDAGAPAPTILFQRDGSFVLRGADGREVIGGGRIEVDPGQLVAVGDEGGDDDWLAGGSPMRARGAKASMRRVGGRVTGDGSLTAALDRLVKMHTPGITKGGGRATWAETDRVVLASASTPPGQRTSPHAAVRRAFSGEDMANIWAVNQTPFPPGVWKVSELRKMLRMVARDTGERL